MTDKNTGDPITDARDWLTGMSLGSKLRPSDFGMFNGVEILTVESAVEAMESYARAMQPNREVAAMRALAIRLTPNPNKTVDETLAVIVAALTPKEPGHA